MSSDTTWPTLSELAFGLAKQLGMGCAPDARAPQPVGGGPVWAWDGRVLYGVHPEGRPYDGAVMLHEIAHWACATPDRRTRPDFGVTLEEEHTAYLVGTILQRMFGNNTASTPLLHDKVDMAAFYRAAGVLLTGGISLTPQITFEARREWAP